MKHFFLVTLIMLCLTGCSPKVVGTLTDARDYLNTGTVGDEHDEFSAYHAMQANLPVIVITQSQEVHYLIIESSKLSMYATDWVKVKGRKDKSSATITPDRIWVKKNEKWVRVYNRKL